MADFDWVRARAACSLDVLFQQLRVAADRDVDSMNAVLKAADRTIVCELAEVGDRFLVTISGNAFPMRIAEFARTETSIAVSVEKGKKKFVAVPTLNPDGVCKLTVNNQELELWQVCRMALEDLFFGPSTHN